jgi:hypothetical protein
MAKNNVNNDKYWESVKLRGYDKLPQPTHVETIEELAAEGERLLQAEGKLPTPTPSNDSKRLQDTLAAATDNPYVRARVKILNDLPKERRERIEQMEKAKNTDNLIYDQFVKMVVKLGDQLSDKSS